MYFENSPAAIDDSRNNHVALFDFLNYSREDIASAQSPRNFCSKQQVAGANPDPQSRTNLRPDERSFQFHLSRSKATSQCAALLVQGRDGGIENVFESEKLRDRLQSRCAHHFMRTSLCHDAPSGEDDDALTQRKDFLVAVRH